MANLRPPTARKIHRDFPTNLINLARFPGPPIRRSTRFGNLNTAIIKHGKVDPDHGNPNIKGLPGKDIVVTARSCLFTSIVTQGAYFFRKNYALAKAIYDNNRWDDWVVPWDEDPSMIWQVRTGWSCCILINVSNILTSWLKGLKFLKSSVLWSTLTTGGNPFMRTRYRAVNPYQSKVRSALLSLLRSC